MTKIENFAKVMNLLSETEYNRRREMLLLIDTETVGSIAFPRFYDFGLAVADRQGNIYFKLSLVNSTIFYGHKDEMKSCYYAEKLPQYFVELANGERILLDVWQIKELITKIREYFGISKICAYNCGFDKRACNNTLKEFFGDVTYWDIMLMAKDTIYNMASYKKFCEENGLMCSGKWSNRPKWSAECMYRFITNDPTFKEAHTGLRDVEIETAIMAECFRKHVKMRKELGSKKTA